MTIKINSRPTIRITELMRQQQLLPINVRIIFKLLVTTHIAYHHKDIPHKINKDTFKSIRE